MMTVESFVVVLLKSMARDELLFVGACFESISILADRSILAVTSRLF